MVIRVSLSAEGFMYIIMFNFGDYHPHYTLKSLREINLPGVTLVWVYTVRDRAKLPTGPMSVS